MRIGFKAVTVLFSIALLSAHAHTAELQDAYGAGEELVERTVCTVQEIFCETGLGDASEFLKRIAKAESDYGRHGATYRSGYFGGIWQIDISGFKATKEIETHPSLIELHNAINVHFSAAGLREFDWMQQSWQICVIPLFSCIAARLYLAAIPMAIPANLISQAHYWKRYYNTPRGKGTVAHFVRVNKGEKEVLCSKL
jgi:hypothetical protein